MGFYSQNLSVLNFNPSNPHTSAIQIIKQSPYNSCYVATCSFDQTVKIWNLNNWALIRTFTGHNSHVYSAEFLNADIIATGDLSGIILIWSIGSGVINMTINAGQYSSVNCLKMFSNGVYLAACLGVWSSNINIYSIHTGNLILSLIGHTSSVNDLVLINGNGNNLLISSSSDNSIRIWDLNKNVTKFILNGHASGVFGLKLVSFDTLASGSTDATIKLWNITSGALIRTFANLNSPIYYSIDLLSDGQTLVSGSWDFTLQLWNLTTSQCLNTVTTSMHIFSLAVVKLNTI